MIFDRRTNYQRGADFERAVRDYYLHDMEALLVVRAAGSHGKADIVAFFEPMEGFCGTGGRVEDILRPVPHVHLVQVKKDGKLPAEEREALLQVAAEVGAVPMLAWHDHGHGVALTQLKEESP